MAIVFGKTQSVNKSGSVVDALFDRDVGVVDEKDAESGASSNTIRVVTNYRGFTKSGPGRKNALLGRTILDVSALGVIPLSELPRLIERLTTLQGELDEAMGAPKDFLETVLTPNGPTE